MNDLVIRWPSLPPWYRNDADDEPECEMISNYDCFTTFLQVENGRCAKTTLWNQSLTTRVAVLSFCSVNARASWTMEGILIPWNHKKIRIYFRFNAIQWHALNDVTFTCILAASIAPLLAVTVNALWNRPNAITLNVRSRILPPTCSLVTRHNDCSSSSLRSG